MKFQNQSASSNFLQIDFNPIQKKCRNQYLPNGGPVKVGLVADVGVVPGRVHHRHRTRVEADRHLFAQEL